LNIIIFTDHINERGTTVSNLDMYDFFNNHLGWRCKLVICGPLKDINISIIPNYVSYVLVDDISEINMVGAFDYIYFLRSGDGHIIDDVVAKDKLLNHIVFPTSASQLNSLSNVFFISRWLAEIYQSDRFVPHILRRPENIVDDMREELNIEKTDLVVGCIGGKTSFDIGFVRRFIAESTLSNVYFVFVNIEKFVEKENVIFLPTITDFDLKERFINSCDVMLHGRKLGESFGIACAEFAMRGKSILTFKHSLHRNHLEMLSNNVIQYGSSSDLHHMLSNFIPNRYCDINLRSSRYENIRHAFNIVIETPSTKVSHFRYVWYKVKMILRYFVGRIVS